MNTTSLQTEETVDVEDVRRQLLQIKESNGLSWTQIAGPSGIPHGTISQFGKGGYQGNNSAIAIKVLRWIESRSAATAMQSTLPTIPGFQSTQTSAEIISVLQYAQIAPDLCVVVGAPGVGKTTTFDYYLSKTPNVWKITLSPGIRTVFSLQILMCEEMAITETNPAVFARRIKDYLAGRQGLIIVDEAQHASLEVLEQLRTFLDLCNVGLILAGNHEIWAKVSGGATRKNAQLASRVGMRLNLKKSRTDDVNVIADAWNIATKKEVDFLRVIAGKPGGLRNVTKTIRLATVVADNSDAIEVDHLRQAWSQLSAEVRES